MNQANNNRRVSPIKAPETVQANALAGLNNPGRENYPPDIDLRRIVSQIEVVNAIPAHVPKKFYDSVKIYVDSFSSPSTKRLYIYNNRAGAWHYVALT